MSPRISPRGDSRKRVSSVFVFGEDPTDTTSIKELVLLHRPDLQGRIQVKRNPASLTRQAGGRPVLDWVSKIEEVIAAAERSGQRVAAILVHRDADCVDPDGTEEKRLSEQFKRLKTAVVPVVPVVTMESWWLLFPDATESIRPSVWKNVLPRTRRNTDQVMNPKAELMTRTGRTKSKYSEADGPSIAGAIRQGSQAPTGTSPSYERFVQKLKKLPVK